MRAAILLGAAAMMGAAVSATADDLPAVLKPIFKDNLAVPVEKALNSTPPCAVRFTELKDSRRDPLQIGLINGRGVHSPADTQVWMQAVVGGLSRRGVTPVFGAAEPAGGPTATFSLKMVWISNLNMTFSAQVVVVVDATGADGHEIHKSYRGQTTNPNLAGWVVEYQDAMDEAFAEALTKMAPDLKGLCQG